MILPPLFIRLETELQGLALPALVEAATGIHQRTFRRRRFAALMDTDRDIDAAREAWLIRNLKGWNLPPEEAQVFLQEAPDGSAARVAFGMGMLEAESCLFPLINALDAAEDRLFEAVEIKDENRIREELGPRSPLGPDYCAPLDMAGLDPLALVEPLSKANVEQWVYTRRAHVVFSLLAGIEHEWTRRRNAAMGQSDFTGRSHFATLLLPQREPARARIREEPDGPFARLVDLVGGLAHRIQKGGWPTSPPTIKAMAGRADRSGARGPGADNERFIRALRSGNSPMTLSNFRMLVRTQCWDGRDDEMPVDAAAVLLPHLVAAQLFTILMPPRADKPGRYDRRGWREGYLGWWQRIGNALGQPTTPVTEHVPGWLFEP